ncbi:MAG: DEAD/DEAH box helicase [Verrucomicrobia bacterium]|nr:DEAD/DEAH box helicase [Verrucomicrobiota bacterium]
MPFPIAEADERLTDRLHPKIVAWFRAKFNQFTSAQQLCIPPILRQQSVLLSSPTGSGKTLAAFLGVFNFLLREPEIEGIRAVYISPLRALAYDIQKNLHEPLREMGLPFRVAMRTGDTPQKDRQKVKRAPPDILLITPESLAIILCQKDYIQILQACRFVIVDEVHSIAETKRGVDLMLSVERLESLVSRPLCRIGLSATVAPLEAVARYLVGPGRDCYLAEAQLEKKQIVELFSPLRKQPYPPAGYTGTRLIEEVARLVSNCRSALIFCNTRSGAETVGIRLKQALPELASQIETHHSSLDRSVRLQVEDRLKAGELRAVVCSTSLEMGIDIGAIDLVIMVSAPKGISRALQRIGRSGHSIHQTSYGVLLATNINDLVECTVTASLARERKLDPVRLPGKCNDVIAQHIVGMAVPGPITKKQILATLRGSWPCRDLSSPELDRLLVYLEGGGRTLGPQYAGIFGKIVVHGELVFVPSRRIERDYLLNLGTIPAEGMVTVFVGRKRLGQVEQGFMKNLNPGDRFVLGGRIVKLLESNISTAKVRIDTSEGPIIPSWNANKMPLTSGIAREVVLLRSDINHKLNQSDPDLADWLVETREISMANALAIINHFKAQRKFSRVPVSGLFLIELYEDRNGLLNYFFHSLIGRSANDALSRILSFRIKKMIGGNAMATLDDYGFLLALRPFQRLTLEQFHELFELRNAQEDLTECLKDSELVRWQFRGVAQTGLMVPRNRPEGERRLKQVHWSAEILFRVLQQHEPDHPLLEEAYKQAEYTFLDSTRAFEFMDQVGDYEWDLRPVKAVSPFAFGMYVSQIKEAMLNEDPETVIERLYHEMYGAAVSTD